MSVPLEVAIAATVATDQSEAEIRHDTLMMIKSLELSSYDAAFERAKEFVLKYRGHVDYKELNPQGCLCRVERLVGRQMQRYFGPLQACGGTSAWAEYDMLPTHVRDMIDGDWGCWCMTLGEDCVCYNSDALAKNHAAVERARASGVQCELSSFYHKEPATIISEKPFNADVHVPSWMNLDPQLQRKRAGQIRAIQEAFEHYRAFLVKKHG